MFGQPANTSFGNQSSPFGQSPFGKPITTTSFGNPAAPVFGNANNSLFGSKTPGTTGGGLFGNTTATPAFGQPATSQSSFGAFSTPNTNTGLFSNQQNANTSLFGATNATPAFGQATKPTAFGFGASTGTGLFGQTHQTTQQTTPSLFGPSNTATNTNLFGATSGFSGHNATAGMTGTVVKFSPLTGSDTMVLKAVTQTISTRHCCIICMTEYEGKSLEELRLEDYAAGRKGQAQGAQTTGMFGSPAQPSTFGNTGVNTSTANTGFRAATAGFGATSQPVTTTGLFGKPITDFGATAAISFTFSVISTTTTFNLIGVNAQAEFFGGLGTPYTSTRLFGNQQNASTSLFGATFATPAFGQATKPTAFGFGASTGTGLFGQTHQTTQQTTPSLFGPSNTAANTNFSGATSGFSGNNAAAEITGTVVQLSPLTGTDTMVINGVTQTISTRHYCITCMKEYESKSLEELRLEDYAAGRKGQAQGLGAATGGFGATGQPATSTGLFGKPITDFGATATISITFPVNSTTTTFNPLGANAQANPFGAAAPTPLFGSTNTTQPATTNTNAFGSFGAPQPNENIGFSNQNKPPLNTPASTASTCFGRSGLCTATDTTGGLFGAKPAETATFGIWPVFGLPIESFGTDIDFGTAPATGSLFDSSFKPAGQTGYSFGTPATPTGLEISSGVNFGTGSSIVAPRKPGGFSNISGTNMSSNSTNAFPLKNDFSVENETFAPRSNPAGECIGSHPTPVPNQVNRSVVALTVDETAKYSKSENSATQTVINPRFQEGTNRSSPNAEIQVIKETQPSEKSLSMEKKEVLVAEKFFQSFKVAKAEEIDFTPTTISTRPLSTLLPVQNINSPNSKSDAKEGANKENQNPTNSIDNNQTDLQCLSKSTMSLSVSDGTLNATPNVNESLSSSSYSSGNCATSHQLDVTSVMSSHRKQRPNVACNTPRCAGYYVIPPLEKLDEYVCGHTCMIPNFTRGLEGYGNYYQPHSFDIYSLDLDEIVHFRNEKIIIYPYDDQRPPIGQYLDDRVKAFTDDMIATDSPGLILITSKWSRLSRR